MLRSLSVRVPFHHHVKKHGPANSSRILSLHSSNGVTKESLKAKTSNTTNGQWRLSKQYSSYVPALSQLNVSQAVSFHNGTGCARDFVNRAKCVLGSDRTVLDTHSNMLGEQHARLLTTTSEAESVGGVRGGLEEKWETMFQRLVVYKEREGNCDMPSNHREDGETLGWWLRDQRKAKKAGKLEEGKAERLELVGVMWDVYEQQWETMFQLLEVYKEREGNCNVPDRHKENGKNLGGWVARQREAKKAGKLETSKVERLEAVGLV